MADAPKPPRSPAGWRQLGLLALLALIAGLLVLRGCGPDPAVEEPSVEESAAPTATD